MATVVLGKNCRLYYRSGGTYGSPTWTEITNAKDVVLSLTYAEADVSTRGGGGMIEPTILSAQLDFEQIRDTDDTVQTALITAFEAGTVLDVAVMEGNIATSGIKGYRRDWKITAGPHNEALADAKRIAFTLKPCYSSNTGGFFTAS